MTKLSLLCLICAFQIILLQNAETGIVNQMHKNYDFLTVRAYGSGKTGLMFQFEPYGKSGSLIWNVNKVAPEIITRRFHFTREICAIGRYLLHQGFGFTGPVLPIIAPYGITCLYNHCLKDVGSIQVLQWNENLVWFNQPNLEGEIQRGAPAVGSKPRSVLYFGSGRLDLVYTNPSGSESRRTCFKVETPGNEQLACPIMDIYKAMASIPEDYQFKEYSLNTEAGKEKCDFHSVVHCVHAVRKSGNSDCSSSGGNNSNIIDPSDEKWKTTATAKN